MSESFRVPDGFKSLCSPYPVHTALPVSTAGIGLVVNEVYKQRMAISRTGEVLTNQCTIYQLYRVSLAQFEYQLWQARSFVPYHGNSCIPFNKRLKFIGVVERSRFNFYPLVLIINGIGTAQMGPRRFSSFMPDRFVSQAFINFSNLEDAVTWLANNPSDWGHNLLPGAKVRNECLQNPEDFWPVGYDLDDFHRDSRAVEHLCGQVSRSCRSTLMLSSARCTFSGEGDLMILVSTTDPVICIPPIDSDAPFNKGRSSQTAWHSPVLLYPETFAYGAYSMVGWTSKELEKTEPWLHVRSNCNSAQVHYCDWDNFWRGISCVPESVEAPDCFKSLASPNPVATSLPVSTAGVGLVVDKVYKQCKALKHKYIEDLENQCTIYQLYRVSLAQFEYQLWQARRYGSYPGNYYEPKKMMIIHEVTASNFYPLVLIINGIGSTQIGKRRFTSFMPNHYVSQSFINFSNLEDAVTWLANNPSDWGHNLLPGAKVRNGRLQNPEDFWPVGYDLDDFHRDRRAVENLCFQVECNGNRVSLSVAKCSFSGEGDPMILVSAADPEICIPPIDSDAPFDEVRSSEFTWHSPVLLKPMKFSYGAYSMVGWTSKELEKTEPWLRVRSICNSAQQGDLHWSNLWCGVSQYETELWIQRSRGYSSSDSD